MRRVITAFLFAGGCGGQMPGGATGFGTGDVDDTSGGSTSGTTGGTTSGTSGTSDTGESSDGSSSSDSGSPFPDVPTFECAAPERTVSCDADGIDPLQAIGLGCPGAADEVIAVASSSFVSYATRAWALPRRYGTGIDETTSEPYWAPREGERMLYMTTGRVDPPDAEGTLVVAPGSAGCTDPDAIPFCGIDNGNPDDQTMPPPINPVPGSNGGAGGSPFADCDGVGDCSDTLAVQWAIGSQTANDLIWLTVELEVPEGTYGYQFDFAWFTSEFPEWVGSDPADVFNDMFVVWQEDASYTGNVVFVDDEPLTVEALEDSIFESGLWGDHPALAGTGFEGLYGPQFCEPDNPFPGDFVDSCPNGGASGWYTASSSATPGTTLRLTFALFDMGDLRYDSAVLIDNWRWSCIGCEPGRDCGIEPAG